MIYSLLVIRAMIYDIVLSSCQEPGDDDERAEHVATAITEIIKQDREAREKT